MFFFRSPVGLIIPLLLIVWCVAVWGADADAIWIDEWWTTHFIGSAPNNTLHGPEEVIERVVANRIHENNPVGYYVLLHLWYRLVGGSDFALRLFSGLCTVLSVALMYQFGRAVGGGRVGLVAAALLGLSAFFLNYSHEMRMYALALVWAVLGLLAYWRFMHGQRASWIWGVVMMVSAAGLLYTHYSNALIIGLLGLVHLFVRPKNRRWWQALGLALGSALLFVPHLVITLNIFDRFVEKVTTADVIQSGIWSLTDVLRMIIMGFVNEQPVFLILLLIALLVTLRTRLTSRQHQGLIFSGALSLGGILMLFILLEAFQTLFHVRYMLVIWPPMALFAALILTISVQRLRWPVRNLVLGSFVAAWIAAGLVLGFDIHFHGLTYSHPVFHNTLTEPTRWDLLGQTLQNETRDNDALVVSVGGDVPWTHTGDAEYYTYGQAARLLMLETKNVDTASFPDFIHGAGRVWMARNAAQDATDQYRAMEDVLTTEGYTPCGETQNIGGAALTAYSIAPQCCHPPQMVIGQFDSVATLQYTKIISHNDSIAVWQGWNVTTDSHESYTVGVYAIDASGVVVGQRDMTLPAAGYSCVLSEFTSAEPDITLHLTVYAWTTGARVPLVGGGPDQLLTLPTR
jgi:hypothetical protein